MFCVNRNDEATLPCSARWVSEIISILSIIFSSIIIYVTASRTKLNVINKLILQILISEILDGIDLLLIILDDAVGENTFENYYFRRGVCFTQIFLSLFVCLWTLTAAFFISFRLFDITVKKGAIFKKAIFQKIHILSIAIPLFITYWFWLGQTSYQAKRLDKLPYSSYYLQGRVHEHFRHMHCWYEKGVNYGLFVLVILIIASALFFSIKGIIVMKGIHTKLNDEIEFGRTSTVNKRKSNVEYIMKTLWIYPITSAILWFLFFILQIIFDNGLKGPVASLIYVIIISVRQFIYALVFLFTQRDIKQKFILFMTCKGKKKSKSVILNTIVDENNNSRSESFGPTSAPINE
jgi:hypothetical protein